MQEPCHSPVTTLLGIKKINSSKKMSLKERRENLGTNLSITNLSSRDGSLIKNFGSFGSFAADVQKQLANNSLGSPDSL